MSNPRSQLVYDLPTRLFHWLFAAGFLTAYVIASTSEDAPAFPYHMLTGLLLGILVAFRLAWGLIGSRHARFTSFALRPVQLASYFKGLFTGGERHWTGHNPASSWAALLMLALAAGLGVTGFLMTWSGDAEAYEDLHELLANAFLAIALLHVAGVVLHGLRHRDGFAASMIDGRKNPGSEAAEPDERKRPVAALALLVLVAASALSLYRNYDPNTQTLDLLGTPLQLGESDEDVDD